MTILQMLNFMENDLNLCFSFWVPDFPISHHSSIVLIGKLKEPAAQFASWRYFLLTQGQLCSFAASSLQNKRRVKTHDK